MDWGDAAGWVSSGATTVALAFAGVQLRQTRQQAQRDRQVEQDGVAVSWRAPRVPGEADPDGRALWTYEFTAHNPGRLPISNVRVVVSFALEVQRVHHDGHVGRTVREIKLSTPVIAGGDRRTWNRNLRMNRNDGVTLLPRTRATVDFWLQDGVNWSNSWPKQDRSLDG